MKRAFSLAAGELLRVPSRKRDVNAQLFGLIAREYGFITRALSLGRDPAWKRQMVALLPAMERPSCLDLACGTGELTQLVARRYPGGFIIGLDLTENMLARAQRQTGASNVRYVQGDMHTLGLPAASVDIVTGGYALRNAPELCVALREIHRVLRPKGCTAFLDFSKPAGARAQRIVLALLEVWGSFWGLVLHANPAVYRYVAASLRQHPDRQQLHAVFEAEGFQLLRSELFFSGMIELVLLQKRGVAPEVVVDTAAPDSSATACG